MSVCLYLRLDKQYSKSSVDIPLSQSIPFDQQGDSSDSAEDNEFDETDYVISESYVDVELISSAKQDLSEIMQLYIEHYLEIVSPPPKF